MPPAKAALQIEPDVTPREPVASPNEDGLPPRLPYVKAGTDRSVTDLRSVQQPSRKENSFIFQPRVPVITGEATYRGSLPVDGVLSGQLNASGSALTIKQRPRKGRADSTPELDGEIRFKDMLRINGHVAGHISSEKGT